jgi:hypothetical protein
MIIYVEKILYHVLILFVIILLIIHMQDYNHELVNIMNQYQNYVILMKAFLTCYQQGILELRMLEYV